MKKILMIAFCLGIVPMLFATTTDTDARISNHTEDNVFRVSNPRADTYDGPRSTPTLIDTINLDPINAAGYCWGLTYDWEMDVLWVSQWNAAYTKVFAIQKTSPCTKVDSFTLGGGAPSYHLGMGFAGSGILYMAGFDANIYEINMTTGAGTVFRTLPWSGAEGLGFNSPDDAVYPGDWGADECAWAQPAQSGAWNTWSLTNVSGLTSAYSTSSPQYLFTCDENTPGNFYQHSFVTPGVPNTTWDSIWQYDPGQTQTSTADCAFDGQYVYILDQTPPNRIWIYDVGITPQTTVTWDFETGWQGWTHTNGAAFPAGWSVEDAQYMSGSGYVCPAPDDSSFWIDSDAAGSGTYVQDTALSPLLTPLPSMDWLWYGWCYNDVGSGDWFEVGIKYFDGTSWTVVPLATYTADNAGSSDSVDVSAYAGYQRVQVYFYFDDADSWAWYAAFDNVTIAATVYVSSQDVGCQSVISPPGGSVAPGVYDVTGRIRNYGTSIETFDCTANVTDTVLGTQVFTQTVTLTDFPVGGDSNVIFGQVTFDPQSYYFTEIFTLLSGDANPGNDTASVYSTTAIQLGDVIYELDIEAAVGGDVYLVGLEFDGDYFYITSGNPTLGPQLYVVDTAGTLIWQFNQPGHSTGWGWRDIAWDNTYLGADQIDTLWSSVNNQIDKWSVDLAGGTLIYHGGVNGPANPNRALAWHDDSSWFFTANWDPCTKFSKTNPNIQTVTGPGSAYGAAYDTDPDSGGWVWWHSQNDPGTGYSCQIDQMEPNGMTWTGLTFGYIPTISATGMAGGMSFHEGFRNTMDVLFCIVQGTPDQIAGVFVRYHDTGIEEQEVSGPVSIGFAPNTPTLVNSRVAISYTTAAAGNVSLKVYDGTGRLVETLVNSRQQAGANTVTWNNDNLSNGVYFFNLEVEETTITHKLILVK